MKRIVSLVLCMALAIGAVTYKPPQAKAVVFEGAALGSLYGSVMGSMGLTYAAGGMNNQSFGLAIWDLMTSWYTDMTPEGESALEFFGNLASAGIQAMAPGQVLLNQSLVNSILQFSEWLYDKYALAENESAVVHPGSGSSITLSDGTVVYLTELENADYSVTGNQYLSSFSLGSNLFDLFNVTWDGLAVSDMVIPLSESVDFVFKREVGTIKTFYRYNGNSKSLLDFSYNNFMNGYSYPVFERTPDGKLCLGSYYSDKFPNTDFRNVVLFDLNFAIAPDVLSLSDIGLVESSPSLSVSAPNGLTISDVEAVTPEQAYALTFEGVTATDVEGIINEAVGRILDGTYSAAGEITDALDVPQDLTWQEHLAQIWENIKALPQTIAQAIAGAFAPDAALVEEITSTFNSKFGWLETIHQLGLDLCGLKPGSQPPVIYIHLEDATGKYKYGGIEKALDMSWYEPYKEDVDNIISGFMWLAFLWLVFKRAADIINGAGMVSDYEFYGSHPIDQPRLEEHKK